MILAPFQSHRPPISSPLATPPTLPVYQIPDTPGRQRPSFISTSTNALPWRLRLKLLPHLPKRVLWSFIALFTLVILCLITLSHGLLSSSISITPSFPQKPKLKSTPGQYTRLFLQRKQIALSPPEELAAIIQFLTSQSSNSLPLSVNPLEPIDPQLVCGFDTRSQRAVEEVKWMREDVLTQYPVLLFVEVRFSTSFIILSILDTNYEN
jgi:hypothetical protein